MKKKIFGGIAVLAIAAAAAFNVNFSAQSNGLSDVSLANVEALAQESTTTYPSCNTDIYYFSCTQYNTSYYCPCASGPYWW